MCIVLFVPPELHSWLFNWHKKAINLFFKINWLVLERTKFNRKLIFAQKISIGSCYLFLVLILISLSLRRCRQLLMNKTLIVNSLSKHGTFLVRKFWLRLDLTVSCLTCTDSASLIQAHWQDKFVEILLSSNIFLCNFEIISFSIWKECWSIHLTLYLLEVQLHLWFPML